MIQNPKYKGKWKPPLIDNPDYMVSETIVQAVSPYSSWYILWYSGYGFGIYCSMVDMGFGIYCSMVSHQKKPSYVSSLEPVLQAVSPYWYILQYGGYGV